MRKIFTYLGFVAALGIIAGAGWIGWILWRINACERDLENDPACSAYVNTSPHENGLPQG